MKTVLITGASSGIGKATALYFAEKGWKVAATMRNPSNETELQNNKNITLYNLDVTKTESVSSAVDQILKDFGQLDALINNAGYGLAGPLEPASEEKIMKQFQTNLFGAIRTIQKVLPAFREQKSGVIVNITSIGGLVGLPFNSIYHATKFGLDGLSESLNYELKAFNIRVKVVAPGGVATDFAGRSLNLTTEQGATTPYDPQLEKVWKAFDRNRANYSSARQIAEVIYQAATDNTDQLRYLAGEDAKAIYALWKKETNEDFNKFITTRFDL